MGDTLSVFPRDEANMIDCTIHNVKPAWGEWRDLEQNMEEIGEHSSVSYDNDGIIGLETLAQQVDDLSATLKHAFLRITAMVPTIRCNCSGQDCKWKALE
ncbi:hypothetical protein KSB_67030 [Ktedonobacter robiniae]|uniref:Uncharacterized protein n=1 Tax=Ktedonobacter robiniae TaxID=2778365 RepID=A0ABQ3UZK2_9CHLR|nr:hypothetical protein KSB_67030 [Ktedonobacter robiniae]